MGNYRFDDSAPSPGLDRAMRRVVLTHILRHHIRFACSEPSDVAAKSLENYISTAGVSCVSMDRRPLHEDTLDAILAHSPLALGTVPMPRSTRFAGMVKEALAALPVTEAMARIACNWDGVICFGYKVIPDPAIRLIHEASLMSWVQVPEDVADTIVAPLLKSAGFVGDAKIDSHTFQRCCERLGKEVSPEFALAVIERLEASGRIPLFFTSCRVEGDLKPSLTPLEAKLLSFQLGRKPYIEDKTVNSEVVAGGALVPKGYSNKILVWYQEICWRVSKEPYSQVPEFHQVNDFLQWAYVYLKTTRVDRDTGKANPLVCPVILSRAVSVNLDSLFLKGFLRSLMDLGYVLPSAVWGATIRSPKIRGTEQGSAISGLEIWYWDIIRDMRLLTPGCDTPDFNSVSKVLGDLQHMYGWCWLESRKQRIKTVQTRLLANFRTEAEVGFAKALLVRMLTRGDTNQGIIREASSIKEIRGTPISQLLLTGDFNSWAQSLKGKLGKPQVAREVRDSPRTITNARTITIQGVSHEGVDGLKPFFSKREVDGINLLKLRALKEIEDRHRRGGNVDSGPVVPPPTTKSYADDVGPVHRWHQELSREMEKDNHYPHASHDYDSVALFLHMVYNATIKFGIPESTDHPVSVVVAKLAVDERINLNFFRVVLRSLLYSGHLLATSVWDAQGAHGVRGSGHGRAIYAMREELWYWDILRYARKRTHPYLGPKYSKVYDTLKQLASLPGWCWIGDDRKMSVHEGLSILDLSDLDADFVRGIVTGVLCRRADQLDKGSLNKVLDVLEKLTTETTTHHGPREVETPKVDVPAEEKSLSLVLTTTVRSDVREIALRTGVKHARKALTEAVLKYLSQRFNGADMGTLTTVLTSDVGVSTLTYMAGALWPMIEDSIGDPQVRSLGAEISRELRVQGGVDILDGFLKEAFLPFVTSLLGDNGGVRMLSEGPLDTLLQVEPMEGGKSLDHEEPQKHESHERVRR